ncbi:MAG: ATP-dependent DNA helicase RecQ [Calditrichaceae bacterium]
MQIDNYLKKYFGFGEFRGQQKTIIEHLLNQKHALVIMPTGSGKSILYQLPALMLPGLTVVISPLIALMKDQVDGLKKKNIDAAFINSSLGKKEREERYRNIEKGLYKMIYVTPERFRKSEFLDVLSRREISLLAVDEAHCISEWGHDFRPDYTRIREFRELMHDPLTIALTATATPAVQSDIIKQLGLQKKDITLFHEGIDRPNLFLDYRELWGEDEKLKEILEIVENNPGSGIVYFVLIKDLMRMSELLHTKKRPHLVYHGDLPAPERKRIQNEFMRRDNNLILATNAFGMGIDKESIRYVVHAQIPGSLEAYYQEIGRAGRDGKKSVCTMLYDEQDLNIQLEFMRWNNPTAEFYDRIYHLLVSDIERVNGEGIDYLKEQMTYKNRRDYRSETALAILERYGVIEGSIDQKNITVVSDLPEALSEQELLDNKLKNEQDKLYRMMLYTKLSTCRKAYIHEYFGLEHPDECMTCDNDLKMTKTD